MSKLELLAEALEYVEQNLQEDLHTEDIAAACYCSKSTIEKLFRQVNHISVRDYVIRRRMTKAARTLVEHPDMTLLDVALSYGYSSNEAFTRVFTQTWNCLPSKYRENKHVLELFPRLNTPTPKESREENAMRMKFDISELYDLFQSRQNCYFVCCDIVHLIPINEISHKAGDLAILEAMHRMEAVAGDEDVIFRIGGDEFVLLTNSEDEAYAKGLVEKILSHNEEPIDFEGRKIPLSLYGGIVKLGKKTMRYNEMFTELKSVIMQEKQKLDPTNLA
ncbi:MAG: helix-turn-helix domain-containing protein [Lachnospiraceae bacterium]|nr:helix-turn-helix domain-containing protein [Lachnospiraceae bacterium]